VRASVLCGNSRSGQCGRALETRARGLDAVAADFYPFDMSFLARAATRVINEVKGVNRLLPGRPPLSSRVALFADEVDQGA
jgi:GMP synthase PP-ATPase subunit